ncbi:MAG: hypothetical protein II936_06955 [Oscillospiraceae bacterium]|nr:hypothetical protein [Oscillospiraceae bacterium]
MSPSIDLSEIMGRHIEFPLPLWLHILFAVLSVAGLAFAYSKQHHKYELYLIIGILSTFLVYLAYPNDIIFYILGVEEFVLMGMAAFDMHKVEKENAAKEKALSEKGRDDADANETLQAK